MTTMDPTELLEQVGRMLPDRKREGREKQRTAQFVRAHRELAGVTISGRYGGDRRPIDAVLMELPISSRPVQAAVAYVQARARAVELAEQRGQWQARATNAGAAIDQALEAADRDALIAAEADEKIARRQIARAEQAVWEAEQAIPAHEQQLRSLLARYDRAVAVRERRPEHYDRVVGASEDGVGLQAIELPNEAEAAVMIHELTAMHGPEEPWPNETP